MCRTTRSYFIYFDINGSFVILQKLFTHAGDCSLKLRHHLFFRSNEKRDFFVLGKLLQQVKSLETKTTDRIWLQQQSLIQECNKRKQNVPEGIVVITMSSRLFQASNIGKSVTLLVNISFLQLQVVLTKRCCMMIPGLLAILCLRSIGNSLFPFINCADHHHLHCSFHQQMHKSVTFCFFCAASLASALVILQSFHPACHPSTSTVLLQLF